MNEISIPYNFYGEIFRITRKDGILLQRGSHMIKKILIIPNFRA